MCCDTPGPDPQVGTAADQEAAIAQQGLNFSENYQTTVEQPLVEQEMAASAQTMAQQQTMFKMNYADSQSASKEYNNYGLPAQTNLYNMAQQYNSSDWQEQQARAAMGDVTNSAQLQQTAMNQNMASRGISANSGMALYNQSMASNQATASGAAAANQARTAARSLGMNLTANAASVSEGGAAQMTALGNAASGNSIGSFNAAAGAVQSGQIGQQGLSSAYTSAGQQEGQTAGILNSQSIANQQAGAASNAATGQAVGAIGMAALMYY